MQKNISGIVSALIVMQLTWVGVTVSGNQVSLARLQVLVNTTISTGESTQARLLNAERDLTRIKAKLDIQ